MKDVVTCQREDGFPEKGSLSGNQLKEQLGEKEKEMLEKKRVK